MTKLKHLRCWDSGTVQKAGKRGIDDSIKPLYTTQPYICFCIIHLQLKNRGYMLNCFTPAFCCPAVLTSHYTLMFFSMDCDALAACVCLS